MATVVTSQQYPPGTDVTAHLLSNVDHLRRTGRPPTPGTTAAATATTSGYTATFADLVEGEEYAEHATVNSQEVWVTFTGQPA